MSTRQFSRDPLDELARVACARREHLLRVHRRRLTREELEDCHSQAAFELLAGARRGRRFTGETHIANALDQRMLSRVQDRLRARRGRSPIEAALSHGAPLEWGDGRREVRDPVGDVYELVWMRHELRRVSGLSGRLSDDQRLVLSSQLEGERRGVFCARHGWSAEKYRKVAQRARARLRG